MHFYCSPVSVFDDLCNVLFMLNPHNYYNCLISDDFNVTLISGVGIVKKKVHIRK